MFKSLVKVSLVLVVMFGLNGCTDKDTERVQNMKMKDLDNVSSITIAQLGNKLDDATWENYKDKDTHVVRLTGKYENSKVIADTTVKLNVLIASSTALQDNGEVAYLAGNRMETVFYIIDFSMVGSDGKETTAKYEYNDGLVAECLIDGEVREISQCKQELGEMLNLVMTGKM